MPILLAAATALALLFTSTVQAQAGIANVGLTADTDTHWCGAWAGKPNPRDLPQDQLLPQRDYKKLFFVEPQLTSPPFRPLMGSEPKVQIPKIWGNGESRTHPPLPERTIRWTWSLRHHTDNVRIALMSFSQQKPVQRVYSSSKSRWADFREALDKVRETCLVKEGTGGAYLVPRTFPFSYLRQVPLTRTSAPSTPKTDRSKLTSRLQPPPVSPNPRWWCMSTQSDPDSIS